MCGILFDIILYQLNIKNIVTILLKLYISKTSRTFTGFLLLNNAI